MGKKKKKKPSSSTAKKKPGSGKNAGKNTSVKLKSSPEKKLDAGKKANEGTAKVTCEKKVNNTDINGLLSAKDTKGTDTVKEQASEKATVTAAPESAEAVRTEVASTNRAPAKKQVKKAVTALVVTAVCILLCVGAYFIRLIPEYYRSRDSLPRFICVTDTDGSVIMLDVKSNLRITLEEGKSVSDVCVNAKEDTAFYIVKDGEKSILCSRYLSSLVNIKRTVSEDAVSYEISKDGKKAAYISSRGELFIADTSDGGKHLKVSPFAGAEGFKLSDDGSILVYTAVSGEKKTVYAYTASDKENICVCDNGELIYTDASLSYLMISADGRLIGYDINKKASEEIVPSGFEELFCNYGGSFYYTKVSEEGVRSLFYHDGEEKCISENIYEVLFTGDVPIAVFCEETENEDEFLYKATVRGGEAQTLNGSFLHGFATDKDGTRLYYTDESKAQTILVGADIGESSLSSFTVIDTDVFMLCTVISGKPVYVKNFNPITDTADLYFNSEKLHRSISIGEFTECPDYISEIKTFESVHNGILRELYACYPVYTSGALLFAADGKLYSFDGKDELELMMSSLESAYPISKDIAVTLADGKLHVIREGKAKELKLDAKSFIYVRHFDE